MFQDLGKTSRILKYRKDINDVPLQYKQNDLKEELVIRYASERYNKQYTNLFPSHPELLLSPMNEFGQRKFISTFISPTLLPYDDLYHFEGCAAFISDHITFEPIEKNYLKIPEVVSTPTMTLKTQKGDCYDISVLLASLLIGAGYNAYCAVGYAKKEVCLNDTKREDFDCNIFLGPKKKKTDQSEEMPERKYKAKEKAKLESKYVKRLEQIKKGSVIPEKKTEGLQVPKEEEEEEEEITTEETVKKKREEEEESLKDRLFCWVILLPTSRDIDSPVYINPANGEMTSVNDDSKFGKVLTVWNHENYWVNMQEEHTNFDLTKENWECIFLGEENEFPRGKSSTGDEEEDDKEVLDLPMSFCKPLGISKERYRTRFPSSKKVVEYRNLQLRRSAPFFEKDLSVLEVNTFAAPNESSRVVLKHVVFEKRKDKLQERIEYFDENDGRKIKSEEIYSPGRKYSSTRMEGIKKIVVIHGKIEEFHFYHGARLDGLSMIRKVKDEKDAGLTRKVIFTFCERDDFLKYRSVNYENVKGDTTIVKKSEKFERNPSKKADEDIEKLEYFPTRLRVLYHFGEDRITQSSKEFTRDGEVQVNLVDIFELKPTREETLNECNELFKMDKRCSDEISRVLEELKDIMDIRAEEEKNIKYERSIYDYLPSGVEEEEDASLDKGREKEVAESSRRKKNDLLSLHIPEEGIKDKEHAIQIFDEIMERTKSRLSMRAQIIQDRLKAEKNLMNKKRLQIQKQDENNKKEDQFLKFWEETIFKTKILQTRCDKNIKESEEYYLKTQMSLLNDERLKDFFKDEVDIQLKDYKDVI